MVMLGVKAVPDPLHKYRGPPGGRGSQVKNRWYRLYPADRISQSTDTVRIRDDELFCITVQCLPPNDRSQCDGNPRRIELSFFFFERHFVGGDFATTTGLRLVSCTASKTAYIIVRRLKRENPFTVDDYKRVHVTRAVVLEKNRRIWPYRVRWVDAVQVVWRYDIDINSSSTTHERKI